MEEGSLKNAICYRRMIRNRFAQLFWGLLIVILDISFNGFDLLVDGLGYLIVAMACDGLVSVSPRFSIAKRLSFVLAVLWVAGLVLHGGVGTVTGLVTAVVNCAFMWQLLGGIADFATAKGNPEIAIRAQNRRVAYVVIMACTTVLSFGVADSRVSAVVVLALILPMFVLVFMILHLVHRAKVELASQI